VQLFIRQIIYVRAYAREEQNTLHLPNQTCPWWVWFHPAFKT